MRGGPRGAEGRVPLSLGVIGLRMGDGTDFEEKDDRFGFKQV